MQERYVAQLGAVRKVAVSLVDAFDFRDEILNSALGCWDGNVYQRLFDMAAKSPLNQKPLHKESFERSLKPLLKSHL